MNNIISDEIVSITYIGERETIDIDVSGDHVFYANGILTHNSAMEEQDHEMYHIAGGISKINTADNVMTIYTSQTLRDSGQIRLQFIKTRSSSGVGKKVFLNFDQTCMRIKDLDEENTDSKMSNDIGTVGDRVKRRSKTHTDEGTNVNPLTGEIKFNNLSKGVEVAATGAGMRKEILKKISRINND